MKKIALALIGIFCWESSFATPFVNSDEKAAYQDLIEKYNQALSFTKFEQAQQLNREKNPDWFFESPKDGNAFEGINLTGLKKFSFELFSKPVIVAILDGGVNINHIGIKDYALINYKEIPNNKIDDDKNGYIDDVHGWDFVGDDEEDTYELAREFVRCRNLPSAYCEGIRGDYHFQRGKILQAMEDLKAAAARVNELSAQNTASIDNHQSLQTFKNKYSVKLTNIHTAIDNLEGLLTVNYSTDDYFINKRTVNYQPGKIGYGTNNVIGPSPQHGTHVAGIVIKIFETALGGKLNALGRLKILPVRVTPDGDERDEDVANAIRYAVDRGATILQMSFGKKYASPDGKKMVDAAVRYAQKHGVLLINSSGNDGRKINSETRFPNRIELTTGTELENWIVVGNSTFSSYCDENANRSLAASSSNYGPLVDLFAPGTNIYSTYSSSASDTETYRFMSGTSMATPVVSGIVAVLKFSFPQMSPAELKKLLLKSVRTYDDQTAMFYEVLYRQAWLQTVESLESGRDFIQNEIPFPHTSRTGGIADIYRAICMGRGESDCN